MNRRSQMKRMTALCVLLALFMGLMTLRLADSTAQITGSRPSARLCARIASPPREARFWTAMAGR